MSVPVDIYVEDITTKLVTYDQIRLYRATSVGGTYSEITTITLVALTRDYEYTDTSGLVTSWYRYDFYHTGTGAVTAQSAPFRPQEQTLRTIRIESAIKAHMGSKGTSGTSNTAYLTDIKLVDIGVDVSFGEGAWVYTPDAAVAADYLRRVSKDGFTVATGRLAPTRAWATAPDDMEYHLFAGPFPPIDAPGVSFSWDRAIREALENLWFDDDVILGLGDGTNTRFTVTGRGASVARQETTGVFLRYTDSAGTVHDKDMSKNGRFYTFEPSGVDTSTLVLSIAPSTSEYVHVQMLRQYEIPYADTDVTNCPLRLAVAASVYRYYRELNNYEEGKWAYAERQALTDLNEVAPDYSAQGEVNLV